MKEDASVFLGDGVSPKSIAMLFGLGLPTIITLYFYISYANTAWFFQDDFGFIVQYSHSVEWQQLLDFSNFGRFLSRNVYWHWGIKLFNHNAEFFYIFNFFIILSSSFLVYKIFEGAGSVYAFIAALFYFILPATIESYAWLSNSQHILGHFFVLLFIYLFSKEQDQKHRFESVVLSLQLALILVLGFLSNIFMSMVLSLPMWVILADRKYPRPVTAYFTVVFGILLFTVFYLKLSENQTGAYSTSYTIEALSNNLIFYFKNMYIATLWLLTIIIGAIVAVRRKDYLGSWFFLASGAFFLPFAFFLHQRYGQYATLSYLFCLLGIWRHLIESKLPRKLVRHVGLVIVICIFIQSLEPPIRYFSENPLGNRQKQQTQFLKLFSSQNTSFRDYCFQPENKTENTTGVKKWDIPREWWFVGFGKAFTIFVDHENTYELVTDATRCDVVFVFHDGQLEIAE